MSLTYRVRFKQGPVPRVHDFQACSPISALNMFHRYVQNELGYTPSGYAIVSMHSVYDGTVGKLQMVESEIDLPKSANPDLKRKDAEDRIDTEMLIDVPEGGKLAD